MPEELKLGKTPATQDPRDLRLAQFLDLAALPVPPMVFSHRNVVQNWGMLGNDRAGNCVWAGAAHETAMWTRESKTVADANFTDASVLSDYTAVTGYNPNDPSTDGGTNMRVAADYRRKTGIVDGKGVRHKVGGYVMLHPGNVAHVEIATYILSAVGIGIQFPASAMDQFRAGRAWDLVSTSPIEGGHYVPVVGKDTNYLYVVTWGKVQPMTLRFFSQYCDEAIAYLSLEMLDTGKSMEGFNLSQLQANLAAL